MNFGAEGERLQQLRRQQAQKYANELKRQMSEKRKRKTTTPATYSTTSGDAYAKPGHKIQYRVAKDNKTKQSNANIAVVVPPKLKSRKIDVSPRQIAKYDYQPTTVPTVHVKVHDFDLEPMVSLQMQQTEAADVDPSKFASRVRAAEVLSAQQTRVLQTTNDATQRISQKLLGHVSSGLEDLTTRVHKVASVDMREKVKRVSDGVASNKSYVESLNAELGSSIRLMEQKLEEISVALPQFVKRTDDMNSKRNKTMQEVRSEETRDGGQADIVLQRIGSVEARQSVVASRCADMRAYMERIAGSYSTAYEDMQKSVSSTVSAATARYVDAITAESNALQVSASSLGNRAVAINDLISDALASLNDSANELTTNVREAATSLSSSISDALTRTQDEVEVLATEISQKLDVLIGNSEENFNAIQGESIKTIEELKASITETRNVLEKALAEEAKAAIPTPKTVLEKYDSFEKLILNELNLQREQCTEIFSTTESKCVETVDHILFPPHAEVTMMTQAEASISRAETAISKLEDQFRIANAQVQDSITTLTQNYDKLSSTFKALTKTTLSSFSKLDQTLQKLEATRVKKGAARKSKVHQLSSDLDALIDSRIDAIEVRLKSLLSRTGNIALRTPKKSHPPESPQVQIAQLVDTVQSKRHHRHHHHRHHHEENKSENTEADPAPKPRRRKHASKEKTCS